MLELAVASEPSTSDSLYADVIVPRHLAGPFTYLVPTRLRTVLQIGQLVVVPFGRSIVKGAVIALTGTPPPTLDRGRLKEIRTVVANGHAAEIPRHLLQLVRMVADAYVAPWGQCLRLVLPSIAPSKMEHTRIILTQKGRDALEAEKVDSTEALTLLRRLKKRPLGIRASTLHKGGDRHQDTLAVLFDRKWVQNILIPAPSRKRAAEPLTQEPIRDVFCPQGNSIEEAASYPKEWEARIVQTIENGRAARLLVQAPAPDRLSLLRYAVRRAVNFGRKVLVVAGESERAQSLAAMLVHDPTMVVACLHSAVPDTKKTEIWEQIRKDRLSVVVGTRSAVFLPLRDIGLIWIDREEDPALKEPQEPRYHAREVAWMRAQHERALLVIASAHLTLETVSMGSKDDLLRTPCSTTDVPKVEVVDLRGQNYATVLSPLLSEAMRETMARQAGVLLFLNRKGYAGALVCRDCGLVPRCESCAVAFAYSREKGLLSCQYCGTTNPIPDLCTACGGSRLQPVGEGTERVEEEVRRRFPSARVLRVDGETMRRQTQAASIRHRIQQREWDVLVGTQLVLRDGLVPTVGLVGVVQADAGLSLPDFRAAERTYHLLRDALGLAQPLLTGGRVILQTYLPSHHTIQAVVQQDETIFQSEEIAQRTMLGFPPAFHVIVLHVSGLQEQTVERAAQAWAARLGRIAEKPMSNQKSADRMKDGEIEHLTVLGPARSPLPRLRGRYRRQILIKSRSRDAAVQMIRASLAEVEKTYSARTVKFDVDIDPVDMW
jgi:primosomal protein N' (replication factor Y) (superfamily II helicase)